MRLGRGFLSGGMEASEASARSNGTGVAAAQRAWALEMRGLGMELQWRGELRRRGRPRHGSCGGMVRSRKRDSMAAVI